MFDTYFGYSNHILIYIINPNYRKVSKEGFFKYVVTTPNTKSNWCLKKWIHEHPFKKNIYLPKVGLFSSINDNNPVKIVATDHAGFHVSGW